jgi:exonuclease VII large subunit
MNEILSIQELNLIIKNKVKDGVNYKIIGNINNVHQSGSNLYFNIKDDFSELGGIIWNYERFMNEKSCEVEMNNSYEFTGKLDY